MQRKLLNAALVALFVPAAVWGASLATVNGKTITSGDLTAALGNLNEGAKANFLQEIPARKKLLMQLIDQEVLAMQAEKDKLDQEKDFKEAMETARRRFLVEKLLMRNVAPKVTDSAAKKHYELHKSRFSTDMVHIQHILVTDEPTARDVLAKAKAKDADFQALAEKFSKDPSAKNNRGDLGPVTRMGPFVDEFKDAAFRAAEGEVVGPIRTDYGYHIIKAVEKRTGRVLGYDEVELRVKEMLRTQLLDDYVNKLKAQAKITVDEKALEKL